MHLDAVIFGGGVAGLWLLDELWRRGLFRPSAGSGRIGKRSDRRLAGNFARRHEIHAPGIAHSFSLSHPGDARCVAELPGGQPKPCFKPVLIFEPSSAIFGEPDRSPPDWV